MSMKRERGYSLDGLYWEVPLAGVPFSGFKYMKE